LSSQAANASSPATTAKPAPVVKRLSPVEIAQRRKDGQCFHCDEHFTHGHKQLFCIEVMEEEEGAECAGDPIDPTISIHALSGIQPRSDKMMHVYVDVNNTRLHALIDSGSTHNFVDLEAAVCAGVVLHDHLGLRIVVANGDRLSSPGCCKRLPITMADEGFVIECYGLALGSYKMVLGVQWLEALGPILNDFGQRTLTRVKDGNRRCAIATQVDGNDRGTDDGPAPTLRRSVRCTIWSATSSSLQPSNPFVTRDDIGHGVAV
jgi:hypothetical protein